LRLSSTSLFRKISVEDRRGAAAAQLAFQANTGNLWLVGTEDDRGDLQLGMMAVTSPSIVDLLK